MSKQFKLQVHLPSGQSGFEPLFLNPNGFVTRSSFNQGACYSEEEIEDFEEGYRRMYQKVSFTRVPVYRFRRKELGTRRPVGNKDVLTSSDVAIIDSWKDFKNPLDHLTGNTFISVLRILPYRFRH